MNIDKIARLFSAQNEPALTQAPANQAETITPQNNEAVNVSKNFGTAGDSDARAAKIASIKAAVEDGTYKTDSRQVAGAVYKELFI